MSADILQTFGAANLLGNRSNYRLITSYAFGGRQAHFQVIAKEAA